MCKSYRKVWLRDSLDRYVVCFGLAAGAKQIGGEVDCFCERINWCRGWLIDCLWSSNLCRDWLIDCMFGFGGWCCTNWSGDGLLLCKTDWRVWLIDCVFGLGGYKLVKWFIDRLHVWFRRLVYELEKKNAEIMREIARLRQNRASVQVRFLEKSSLTIWIFTNFEREKNVLPFFKNKWSQMGTE